MDTEPVIARVVKAENQGARNGLVAGLFLGAAVCLVTMHYAMEAANIVCHHEKPGE